MSFFQNPAKLPELFAKDRELFWRFRVDIDVDEKYFDGAKVAINSDGIRGKNIPPISKKTRIIALGDSQAFGWGINEDDTFIGQLGEMIKNDGNLSEIEIYNAAIPGYSSFQGRRFFVSDVSAMKPDIILILFGWSDHQAALNNTSDYDIVMPYTAIIEIQNIFSRLKIYQFFKSLIVTSDENTITSNSTYANSNPRVSVVDFYNNLNVIVNYARSEGITPILLTSPSPPMESGRDSASMKQTVNLHNIYNMQVRLLARNAQSPLIDLAAELGKFDLLYDDALNAPMNLNTRGHRFMAESIISFFRINPDIIK